EVVLLSPAGSAPPHQTFYAEFSWLAADNATAVPTSDAVWKTDGKELTPATPLKLTWDNGHGLTFTRTVAVDDRFMFTITDDVRNASAAPVTLYPFGLVTRQGIPATAASSYTHEGPLGVVDGTLGEYKYK